MYGYAVNTTQKTPSPYTTGLISVLNDLGLDIAQRGIIVDIQCRLAGSPGRVPSMKEMANSLHLNPRTLRRRLLDVSKNYRQIIIDFRMATARQYLQSTELPANEISTLTGYADTANFYRTFQKQIGMTPADFRQSHSQQNQLDTV